MCLRFGDHAMQTGELFGVGVLGVPLTSWWRRSPGRSRAPLPLETHDRYRPRHHPPGASITSPGRRQSHSDSTVSRLLSMTVMTSSLVGKPPGAAWCWCLVNTGAASRRRVRQVSRSGPSRCPWPARSPQSLKLPAKVLILDDQAVHRGCRLIPVRAPELGRAFDHEGPL